MIGETLGGRYTIVRRLGEGGMGTVYEARHTGTGRRVAVKVILGDYARNPKLVARFEVEARAAGTIESEHIVHVTDVGRDDTSGAPFLAMEYLAGEGLEGLFERLGPVDPDLALRIGVQVCLGLERAHALEIVHRDLKPANLFLAERDGGELRVKILDFGVAKVKMEETSGESTPKLTRTGALIGSPRYMSPEQALGKGKVDQRSDLWSLGVVLYEALAGRQPFEDVEGIGELIMMICSEPVAPIRNHAPWVDPAIAMVVERALIIDSDQRWQRAAEMREALAALLPHGHTIRPSMLISAASGAAPAAPHAIQRTSASTFQATVPGIPMDVRAAAPPAAEPPAAASPPRTAILVGALLAGAAAVGFVGAYSQQWIGGKTPASPGASPPPPSALALPASADLPASAPPPPESPLASMQGAWRSDKGRIYDAVRVGDRLEFRIRNIDQFAGQGYAAGEARFVLLPPAGPKGPFGVEDRVRPLPPEGMVYDAPRALPSCVGSWSEVGGEPLEARVEDGRLHVRMAFVEASPAMFVGEGVRVVACKDLARARATVVESELTRQ